MAETIFKIIPSNELLEKITQELEILEEIYSGEGIVLKRPELIQNDLYDKKNHVEISKDEKEFIQTPFLVTIELDIKPKIGLEIEKIGILTNFKLIFNQFYPFNAPQISLTNKKGLDDD
jgi:hypothetical protein